MTLVPTEKYVILFRSLTSLDFIHFDLFQSFEIVKWNYLNVIITKSFSIDSKLFLEIQAFILAFAEIIISFVSDKFF